MTRPIPAPRRLAAVCLLLAALALPGARLAAGACDDDPTVSPRLKAAQSDPKNPSMRFNLAAAYYNKECWAEALDAFKEAIRTSPADKAAHASIDWEAWQVIGMIQYQVNKDDAKAQQAFNQSLELKPGEADTLYGLALSLTRQEKWQEAEPALRKAMAAPKGLDKAKALDAQFRLAVILHKRWEAGGKADEALLGEVLAAFNATAQAAAADPQANREVLAIAHNQLGLLYRAKGDHAKAIENFRRAIKASPDDYQANFLLGLEYYAAKDYEKMVEAYERATKASPREVDARYNLGVAYMNQQRYDLAAEQFRQITEIDPKNSEALSLLAQSTDLAIEQGLKEGTGLLADEKYAAARDAFKRVLALDGGNKTARRYLGEAEDKLEAQFKAAMDLAAKARAKKDRLEELTQLEQALAQKPDDADALARKEQLGGEIDSLLKVYLKNARAAFGRGEHANAVGWYDKALKLKPGWEPAALGRANALKAGRAKIEALMDEGRQLAAEGNLKAARGRYEAVLELERDNKAARAGLAKVNTQLTEKVKTLVDQGHKAQQAGAEDDAKALYNRALALDPDNQAANAGIKALTGSESKAKVNAAEVKKLYYQGVDQYVNGQIEGAIDSWAQVLKLQPDHRDARKNLERAKEKLAAIRQLGKG